MEERKKNTEKQQQQQQKYEKQNKVIRIKTINHLSFSRKNYLDKNKNLSSWKKITEDIQQIILIVSSSSVFLYV